MNNFAKPVVMTVAGFDPGGGAGIIADLKTFHSLGVYGVSLISCFTAQNHDKFLGISEADPGFFKTQLAGLNGGYKIKAVKSGLLTKETSEIIGIWKKENPDIPLIVDPVFTATSGKDFFTKGDIGLLKDSFYGFSDLITPNLFEASILSGIEIKSIEDMLKAGRGLSAELNVPILIKGGHLDNVATDILFYKDSEYHFGDRKIKGVNTHGSGCILSAAITSYIALGDGIKEAVVKAKNFVTDLMIKPSGLSGVGRIIEP